MHLGDDCGRVAVLAAMVPEIRPLVHALDLRPARVTGADGSGLDAHRGAAGSRQVLAAVTGIGTSAATEVTSRLLDAHPVDHVIVVGVCGGVASSVAIGELVAPRQVVDEASGRAVEPVVLGEVDPTGVLLTSDVLHNQPEDLEVLRGGGVVAVDMETASIGAVCEDRGLPWSVFRAVSDRAGDPAVDGAVLGLAKVDGTADPPAIARFVLTRPWRVPGLVRLGRGLRAAVAASTDAALAALSPP